MPALLWLPIRESNPFHLIHSTSVSSWSFRPSRYVLSHSHLPHTSMTSNGISSVIPAHLIPFHSPLSWLFLPPRLWAFHSPLTALKSLTGRPDIFPRTHWSQWARHELYIPGLPSLFCLPQQPQVVWPSPPHNVCLRHTSAKYLVRIQRLSLGHHCHHYFGFPFGNPIFSTKCIHHNAGLSKGFLDLMLQAKLSDPILIGLWARSADNGFDHAALGITKGYFLTQTSLGIQGFAFSPARVAWPCLDLLNFRLPPFFLPCPLHMACGFPSFPLLLSWAFTLMLLTLAPFAPSSLFRAARLPWGSKVICAVSSMGIQSDLLLSQRYHLSLTAFD